MSLLARGCVLGFAVLFGLHLDIFLYAEGYLPVPPLYFVAAFLGFSLLRADSLLEVTGSLTWRVCFGYLALALLGFTAPDQPRAAFGAVKDVLLALMFVTGALMLLREPTYRRAAVVGYAISVIVSLGLNVYETLHPLTWSHVYGRSAGLFMNPNIAANALLSAAAFFGTGASSSVRMAFVLGVNGAGILPTFSRGGVLGWLALTTWFTCRRSRGRPVRAAFVLLLVGSMVGGSLCLLPSEILEVANVAARINFMQGDGPLDASASERLHLVERSQEMIEERPVMGHGPGSSRHLHVDGQDVGVHNEFLSVLIDYGCVGLLVWLGYLGALFNRRTMPVFIVLLLSAMSFHSVLLSRQTLLFLALFETTHTPLGGVRGEA